MDIGFLPLFFMRVAAARVPRHALSVRKVWFRF
jgi:hypothetical protein